MRLLWLVHSECPALYRLRGAPDGWGAGAARFAKPLDGIFLTGLRNAVHAVADEVAVPTLRRRF